MEVKGLEPLTYGLQSHRSSQLSYTPYKIYKKEEEKERTNCILRNLSVLFVIHKLTSSAFHMYCVYSLSRRKEVIQPHFPVRLPCYDFTPLTRHTFGTVLRYG